MSVEYSATLSSAREFAAQGRIEEWVHAYLCGEGHNKPFSDGLKLCVRYYTAPIALALSKLSRCCGPEENMPYRVHPEVFERKVRGIMDAAESGADLPPLIVNYGSGNFTLNDGNHRYEAYSRLGRRECEVIIWTTAEQDMTDFKEKYGF